MEQALSNLADNSLTEFIGNLTIEVICFMCFKLKTVIWSKLKTDKIFYLFQNIFPNKNLGLCDQCIKTNTAKYIIELDNNSQDLNTCCNTCFEINFRIWEQSEKGQTANIKIKQLMYEDAIELNKRNRLKSIYSKRNSNILKFISKTSKSVIKR